MVYTDGAKIHLSFDPILGTSWLQVTQVYHTIFGGHIFYQIVLQVFTNLTWNYFITFRFYLQILFLNYIQFHHL